MKKLSLYILCLFLMVALIAGCNKTSPSSEEDNAESVPTAGSEASSPESNIDHQNENDVPEFSYGVNFRPLMSVPICIPIPAALSDGLRNEVYHTLDEVYNWMPDRLTQNKAYFPDIMYHSNKLFSTYLGFEFREKRLTYVEIANTIDLQTGKILYLDDVIEVDRKLAEQILKSGFAHLEGVFADKSDVYSQSFLNKYDPEYVLERLAMCSEPYDQSNYPYKPTFYLKSGRLYLINIFPQPFVNTEFYIDLEDISDQLKIDKW